MTADQVVLVALRLAMVALLYLFLAWVIRALWADLRAGTQRTVSGASPRLVFVDGATGGPAAGDVVLVSAATTIGRAEDNCVVIEDEFISAHHAVLRREQGAEPNRDGEGRNRAKNSRPFPFEYKKEDEGARNEFDAGSKADQHSSIPRGDDKEVNDDQSNQHEVDLPEENVSREGLERQTGHCHNACGGKGHSKASSAHDHYKQIAADRHRREDPA